MNARPFTILIVSPDRTTLRRLSKFLEVFGFDVRQATSSQQTLAAAQAARPDYLVLDASSGEAVDLQLCRQVRRLWPQAYTYALLLAQRPEAADVTAALEAGFDDFLAAPVVFGELLARLRAGARVIEFERRLSDQVGLEPVTVLPDRAALAAKVQIPAAGQSGAPWLALIDLDYFFRIADQCGRPTAESLLQAAAQLVQTQCPPGGFCASVGGDQVALLLPAQPSESAVSSVEAILASVAQHPFEISGQTLQLTASAGLVELATGETLDAALVRAERGLRLAKSSGRNCVVTSEDVDREADAWAALAADGKLFETTLARDVMQPCPLLLCADETLDQASSLLALTGLHTAPVIDSDGKLVGTVTAEQLAALRAKSGSRPRGGSSVRLVRHVMTTDIARFDEATPLSRLLEYFGGAEATLAVIVRDRQPRGLVHCQGLAALNEKLTAGHFASAAVRTQTSQYLLVPELAMAE